MLPELDNEKTHALIAEEAERILEEIKKEPLAPTLQQGFVFDILIKEDNKSCVLIELNGFGALRG